MTLLEILRFNRILAVPWVSLLPHASTPLKAIFVLISVFLVLFAVLVSIWWASHCRIPKVSNIILEAPSQFCIPGSCGGWAWFLDFCPRGQALDVYPHKSGREPCLRAAAPFLWCVDKIGSLAVWGCDIGRGVRRLCWTGKGLQKMPSCGVWVRQKMWNKLWCFLELEF